MKWVETGLVLSVLALGMWAQEKAKDPVKVLQEATANLAAAENAMKDSALETQQRTIKYYQAVQAQQEAYKSAAAGCKGDLVQEQLVWACRPKPDTKK